MMVRERDWRGWQRIGGQAGRGRRRRGRTQGSRSHRDIPRAQRVCPLRVPAFGDAAASSLRQPPLAESVPTDWNAICAELLEMARATRLRDDLARDGSLFRLPSPHGSSAPTSPAGGLMTPMAGPSLARSARARGRRGSSYSRDREPSTHAPRPDAAPGRGERGESRRSSRDARRPHPHLEGRPQRYAPSSIGDEHGHLSPLPLENPEGVDARRRAIGSGRWPGSAPPGGAMARGPERPPADWAARSVRWKNGCGKSGGVEAGVRLVT